MTDSRKTVFISENVYFATNKQIWQKYAIALRLVSLSILRHSPFAFRYFGFVRSAFLMQFGSIGVFCGAIFFPIFHLEWVYDCGCVYVTVCVCDGVCVVHVVSIADIF